MSMGVGDLYISYHVGWHRAIAMRYHQSCASLQQENQETLKQARKQLKAGVRPSDLIYGCNASCGRTNVFSGK
jgi:histidine ammonia-lyase